MALNLDIERGLLAVPGQSYNLLLNRSGNFDEYAGQLYTNYGWNALDMQMNLALIQGLWDRAEPTGLLQVHPDQSLAGNSRARRADPGVQGRSPGHQSRRTHHGSYDWRCGQSGPPDSPGLGPGSQRRQRAPYGLGHAGSGLRQPGPTDHQHSPLGGHDAGPAWTCGRASGFGPRPHQLLRNGRKFKTRATAPATQTISHPSLSGWALRRIASSFSSRIRHSRSPESTKP